MVVVLVVAVVDIGVSANFFGRNKSLVLIRI